MVERVLSERLQPSLLDRLTDHARDNTHETGRSWIIDVSRLREIIQRDLRWLFNTTNMEISQNLEAYPHVAKSVLNFGLTDVSGTMSTARRALDIRQAIRDAIENFEPRLLPETLEINIRQEKVSTGSVISFDIRAELWAEPVPVDLYLRTALDLTTGEVELTRTV